MHSKSKWGFDARVVISGICACADYEAEIVLPINLLLGMAPTFFLCFAGLSLLLMGDRRPPKRVQERRKGDEKATGGRWKRLETPGKLKNQPQQR
ncbi:hypothetical protein I7I50_02680 [Histoplasma capsulatum G186AR]|uniref:Uncharacterized protein n=1 Tax=Ajellomyces capsulatus TaxID=5037 RepID=A0A8H7Z2C8_AJECA|nr:hypothetical protein I7I52_00654 [Histoplasma capsulatum]QSS71726.1 hypothetical protein I7I50_02680 [Histoplasma capsulatum G186AR]